MNLKHTPIVRLLSLTLLIFLIGAAPLHAQKKNRKNKKNKGDSKGVSTIEDRLKLEALFISANESILLEEDVMAAELLKKCLELDPNHSASLYELARLNYQNEKPNEAIQYAEAALKGEPNNKWYRVLLAECYASIRDYDRAADMFNELRKQHPENIDFYFDVAFLYKNLGKIDEAIEVLDDLEKTIGKEESVLLEKQKLYMMQNKVDKAAGEVRKLIDAYPSRTNYYNLLAELYLVNKRQEEADAVYRELMLVDPDNPFGQLAMVDKLEKEGKSAEADKMLRKVFANPAMTTTRKVQLLMLRYNLNDPAGGNADLDEALDLTELMIKAHPNESRVFAIKGDLLYNRGDRGEAAVEYRKAVDLDPNNLPIWEQIFFLDIELGDNKALVEDTNRAKELFPNIALPYYFNGIGLNRQGQHEAAIKSLKRALIIGDENKTMVADIYSQIGESYNSLKKYDKSDENFDKALELDPDNAIVLNNYSYYLSLRRDNLVKAEEMSRKTIEQVPNNANFLDTYGWILYEMGRYEDAESYLKKSLDANGKSATVLEHYADTLLKLGRAADAAVYYERALKIEDKASVRTKLDTARSK